MHMDKLVAMLDKLFGGPLIFLMRFHSNDKTHFLF